MEVENQSVKSVKSVVEQIAQAPKLSVDTSADERRLQSLVEDVLFAVPVSRLDLGWPFNSRL